MARHCNRRYEKLIVMGDDDSGIALDTKVARYRTALVALLELVTRNGNEYRTWDDQMLIAQIRRMLDEDRPG